MAPPVPKALHCRHCSKSFGRTEHLKRHELIHTKERQFRCSACSKEFMRRDALQRHELTHQATSPSLLAKGIRACVQCAAAKARCSGEAQCSRCLHRDLQCSYPDAQSNHVQAPVPPHEVDTFYARDAGSVLNLQNVITQTPAIETRHNNPLPISPQLPLAYDPTALDTDFVNILSQTNWLDAVDTDFAGLPLDFDFIEAPNIQQSTQLGAPLSAWNEPSPLSANHTRHHLSSQDAASPRGVSSTFSGPSAASTESAADVWAAQEDQESAEGEYYVDGNAARLPRTKRRKLSSKVSLPTGHASVFKFSLRSPTIPGTDFKHRIGISDEAYETFQAWWRHTCQSKPSPWPAFEESEFPSKELFEYLLGLYFAKFHQTLPFLHPPSFESTDAHWLLLLAMTGLGARFVDSNEAERFASSLQELLRRCLMLSQENTSWAEVDDMVVIQIRLLHAVGLIYSGKHSHRRQGIEMQQILTASYSILLRRHAERAAVTNAPTTANSDTWVSWVQLEATGRTAYSIWLLDCMWSYQFRNRPLLGLEDCTLPLPCQERHWNAATAAEWRESQESKTIQPTLNKALQEVYIDKRLPRDRGEFARILMIHGLFHRSWEVEHYFLNPLSHWEPTAKKQTSSEVLPQSPVSLHSVPTYIKWQNSVCDCLDILHWQANATIGQASGLEHPTVAFLHLARVVLLSPINSIVDLVTSMARADEVGARNVTTERRMIQQWAVRGQYKARLAAIHAGVVFWHIRRYSVDGFYEAPAVALAALLLWAFGTFSSKQETAKQNAAAGRPRRANEGDEDHEGSSDDSTCDIILLDRPADDEIVQQFVRRGQTMRANIGGVGDLYGPLGPERVLAEGCRILRMLKCWGVGDSWLDLLLRLGEVCKQQRERH